LDGGDFYSIAIKASWDGSVIVGHSLSGNGTEAFRWTQAEGMMGLGDLPGGEFNSKAYDVSADGSVIVGYSRSTDGLEAFRWTLTGGIQGLGDLPGGEFQSQAYGVSANGSVIVGTSRTQQGSEAFLWTQCDGMRSLQEILTTDFGLDLTGWRLLEARAVSADGTTIVGYGFGPNGLGGFVATLPEPPSIDGDLDGDGFVGIADLNIVLGSWNQSVPPGDALGDPSGDGFVGIEDLNTVLGNWNAGTPPSVEASSTVPEPGVISILTIGGLTLLRRHIL
jgi:probable HAF family extracellular repeat protein